VYLWSTEDLFSSVPLVQLLAITRYCSFLHVKEPSLVGGSGHPLFNET